MFPNRLYNRASNRNPKSSIRKFGSSEGLENRVLMAADAFGFMADAGGRDLATQTEQRTTLQLQATDSEFTSLELAGENDVITLDLPQDSNWNSAVADTRDAPTLPPQLEQLRAELGDENFAAWLQSNAEQTGTLQGVSQREVEQWQFDAPELAQQFFQVEETLDQWLQHFHSDPGASSLPNEFEELRLELGDLDFSNLLVTNFDQFGTLQGIPLEQIEIWELESPDQAVQFHMTEELLDQWLHTFEDMNQGPVDPLLSLQPCHLPGDLDLNGNVEFADFLVLSANFGQQVDAAFAAGDIDANGIVDFADFLELSGNFGEKIEPCGVKGEDVSDDAPEDGEVIQEGGAIEIRAGSRIFISDVIPDGYDDLLRDDAPRDTPIEEGMTQWQDIIDKIKDLPDGSITGDLVIVGHGADGGVGASGSDIDGENLTEKQAEILKKKLGPNARIIVLGCDQADAEDNDHMQDLADSTGVPVIGNQDGVYGGTEGDGDWYRFDPSANLFLV